MHYFLQKSTQKSQCDAYNILFTEMTVSYRSLFSCLAIGAELNILYVQNAPNTQMKYQKCSAQ